MFKETLKNICIINCFDTYEHRVDLLYKFFKAYGANVRVITSNYRHFEKCVRTDKKADYELVDTIQYRKNLSMKRLESHVILSRNIFKIIEKEDFDLLWVLVPPNSLVKDAAKYKTQHANVKLIFDLIDLWPETMPISKFKSLPPFVYWRRIRDQYLDAADIIVTECNLYHKRLPQCIQSKLRTIYLARNIKPFNSNLNLPENRISLCYLGSINNIIDISSICNLIQSIKRTRSVELHIVGDGEKRNEFIEKCKLAGAYVKYHGKIYDSESKQKIFDSCHFGLNFMKDSVFVGLTMKSIDYFEGGIPIINNIRGDIWKIVEKYNLGINYTGNEIIRYKEEQRKNSRKFFEENLSQKSFYELVSAILEECYGGNC